MRVAHILRKYEPAEWGGTETALQHLISGLHGLGVGSVVFCPGRSGRNDAGSDPLAQAGATIRRYRACVPVLGISDADRRQMLAVGGNLLSFDLPRLLRGEPAIDVLHTHTLGRIGGIALTMARRRRVPLVVTIHGGVLDLPDAVKRDLCAHARGFEWGRVFGWWWRARRVLADADTVLTCNPSEASLLRRRHPRLRVVVQPHGVPLARYRADHRAAARAALPEIAARRLVLCVGRIDPVKNQLWLVRQVPSILQRHPGAMLVLAGAATDPAYEASVRDEICRLGVGHRVRLAGGFPPLDPRLLGLMQEASVVVLPSISETFGLVILEAWASGAPVVASRTSGAAALIRHGQNGWLFDQGDDLNFNACIDRVLRERDRAAAMCAEGAGLVARDYDTQVLAGRMRNLYAALAAEKHATRHPAR